MTTFGHYHSNTPLFLTEDQSLQFQRSLIHRWHCDQSILCVIPSPKRKLLFCGTQNNSIIVFDLVTFQKKLEFHAHQGSVLCLTLNENEDKLFSAGSDSLINIWEITDNENDDEFVELSHTIYSLLDIGDIFSLIWVDQIQTLFFGTQNATISFIKIEFSRSFHLTNEQNFQLMPSQRFDKFFNSKGSGRASESPTNSFCDLNLKPKSIIQVPVKNMVQYAHNGFVYSLQVLTDLNPLTSTIGDSIADHYSNVLISGGGDGMINLWGVDGDSIIKLKSIDNNGNSVMSMSLNSNNLHLFAGLNDGQINCWDLTTFQIIKSWSIDDDDVESNFNHDVYSMALSPSMDSVFMGTPMGITKRLQSSHGSFRITLNEPCLALLSFKMGDESYIVSSSSNKTVSIWSIKSFGSTPLSTSPSSTAINHYSNDKFSNDKFLQTLSELISFKTVSQQPDLYQNDCRDCANHLVLLLRSLGASRSELWPVDNGNPIVNGIFTANSPKVANPKTLIWYAHYDVIPASTSTWDTPPFQSTPKNGYIYARGSTDNKGPLLASIFAVAELFSKGELTTNVIFIIEGEEESGSWGFNETIERNLCKLSDFKIDWILMSNSYWLDDETPCLNYGLRGVIRSEIEISSDSPDRHSGVHGGVVSEPSMDLIKVCSNLVNGNEINIDGFKGFTDSVNDNDQSKYDFKDLNSETIKLIMNLAPWEIPLYIEIAHRLPNIKIHDLIKRWREPALSLHRIEMSGPNNGTVIPQSAKAKISMRLVPGQDLEIIKKSIIKHIGNEFTKLNSPNHLKVKIVHESEPWLGDVNNKAYRILFEAIESEWGVKPIYIREGGSVPAIRYLERVFKCPAAHLPAGQSSDNAHLNNERIRIINLFKAKDVIKRFIEKNV